MTLKSIWEAILRWFMRTPTPKPPAPGKLFSKEIIRLHNEIRAQAGIDPLISNSMLFMAAIDHANWMAAAKRLTHDDLARRISITGYRATVWGENIASGQRFPEEVMQTWMGSRGHRSNILRAEFREIGVGAGQDDQGRLWWCVIFGSPAR